jgi:hypothetical protein
MIKKLFFFLFFTTISANNFEKAPSPDWVKKHDVPLNSPIKSSQIDTQRLLIDVQKNWEEKTNYYHIAKKALNKVGVEQIGQVRVSFDPSYEKVVFHSLRIFRDGEWLDRLESSRHDILQREQELDDKVYNGDLTLILYVQLISATFSISKMIILLSNDTSVFSFIQTASFQ